MAFDYSALIETVNAQISEFGGRSVYEYETGIVGDQFSNQTVNVTQRIGASVKLLPKGNEQFLRDYNISDIHYFFSRIPEVTIEVGQTFFFGGIEYEIKYVTEFKPNGIDLLYQEIYCIRKPKNAT